MKTTLSAWSCMGLLSQLLFSEGHHSDSLSTSSASSHHDASLATAFASSSNARQVTQRAFFDVDVDGKRLGRITLGLFGNALPKTVSNFAHLAKCDLPDKPDFCYRGSPFHRIIPGFMIQGGDFTNGDGTGGASMFGRTFADEVATSGHKFPFKHESPYLLSMANAGPDTNGSQFFITTAKTPWLDNHHTVFGEVQDGQDIVRKLESLGSESGQVSSSVTISDSGLLGGSAGSGAKFL